MQVHDELVLEVPQGELDPVKVELPRLMARVLDLAVPLSAEVGAGSIGSRRTQALSVAWVGAVRTGDAIQHKICA